MNKINASSTTSLSNIDLLPNEVMVEIFNNVSTITLLSKCSLVNNLWYQVVKLNLKDRFTLCEISNTLFSIVKQELPFVTIETFYLCAKQIVEHLINKFNETQSLHVLYLVGALSQNINEDAKKIVLTEGIDIFGSLPSLKWVTTVDEKIRTNMANFFGQLLPEESHEYTIDNPYTIKILLDNKNKYKEDKYWFISRYQDFIFKSILDFVKKTAFESCINPSDFYHHLITFAYVWNLYQSPIHISGVKNLKSKEEFLKITEEFIQLLELVAHEKFYKGFDVHCSTLLAIIKKDIFKKQLYSNLLPLLCSRLTNKNYSIIRMISILTREKFKETIKKTSVKQAYSTFKQCYFEILFSHFLHNCNKHIQNLKAILDLFFPITGDYYLVNDCKILRLLSVQFQMFNDSKSNKVRLDELDEECRIFFTNKL
ncbi:hypothetical protein BN1013_01063 [Candidatus Rubidus massiliensis]|nr:hypothetical protein BN1013_01063 [Candidatus Rubidus massiliensis]